MTKEPKSIQGSGGGGRRSAPRQPSRAPDTLNSRQFATIQDVFSEGEIEGYATPSKLGITNTSSTEYNNAKLKDIFLDDTPIVRSTASNTSPQTSDFNFQDVTIEERFGTANQSKIGGIEDSAGTPETVGVTVTHASGGVVRQVQAAGAGGTNPSALRITITFPQIQHLKDNGDIEGSTVRYQIFVEYNNAGYPVTPQIDTTVSGRTGDRYQRDHRIDITGDFPLNVKVVRITNDSSNSNLINEFEWTTLQQLFDVASTYANTAYNQVRIDSKQFSSFPVRKYKLRGTKIRIPGAGANSSGTPSIDGNTGRIIYPENYIFNGTMQAATWCSCPSMAMLDILTTVRYGFGDHINDENLDLFSFVEASKYANEEVDDMTGTGSKEARFSCNVVIQAPNDAFDIINELASVMRCNPIWSNGSLMLAQDRPTDASYLFNLGNVDSNGFSYTGASLKQRHTVISVAYYNMDAQDIDYEVVEDADGIAKFGNLVKQVKAFGCTSRGQAQRYGKSVLFSEQQESELVTFNTSLDAALLVRPGSVIEVNDPVRAGGRRGGRVVAATSSTVTIDALSDTTLSDLNQNVRISVLLSDGNVETGSVSSIIGAVFTVNNVTRFDGTTSTTFSQVPEANTPYLISSDDLQTQKFRVISVEETDGVNFTIQAITYLDGKYANIEQDVVLPTIDISNLDDLKDPPQNLTAIDKIAVINNQAVAKIFVSWKPVDGVTQYQVNYRKENGNFTSAIVLRPDFEILNSEEAKYEIEVYSFNGTLKLSASPSSIEHNATGKSAIPSDVQNLSIEPVSQGLVRLRWDKSEDADVIHGGRVYIRHSNKTDGSGSFQNSTDLVRAIAGSSTEAVVPSLEGEYILKFQDDGGRFSSGETSVIVDLPDTTKELTIKDQQEQTGTPFNGSKTNVSIVNTNTLQLTNPATNSTGNYEFESTLDLAHTYSLVLKKHIQTVSFYSGNNIDDRTANIDTWTDFDGGNANDTNVQTLVRTTTGDPSGSPTYTSYNQFANGTFKGRAFQFKLILSTDDPAQNVTVQQAGFKAIFEVRTETPSSPIASGTSAKAVTFDNAFFTGTSSLGGSATAYLPSIGITIQNAQFNDHFSITSVTATGFTIEIKNSNSFVNRNFIYQAVGYGKRV